MVLMGHNYYKI